MAKQALVIGGSRGLGAELVAELGARGWDVSTTVRSTPKAGDFDSTVNVISNVDLGVEGASADALEAGIKGKQFNLVIYSAGYFTTDTLDTLNWSEMQKMITICSISPAFIIARLVKLDALAQSAKMLLVTTEGGSITLRTAEEGGNNYGHHMSKAAGNMAGKLLAVNESLRKNGITVVNVHPGFMRTEMTASIGYDKYWDEGGAVEPAVAAKSLLDFGETVTQEQNGQFWAPRGPRDIGESERVLGKDLPTPLQLPY